MMAHIVQEAFIFTMVLSFLSKSWPLLGLWQFVSLCLRRWNSFKMSVEDSTCLLMFSHDCRRGFHRELSVILPIKPWFSNLFCPTNFLTGKSGSSADGGRISTVEGWLALSPGCPADFHRSPGVSGGFTPSALVFLHLNSAGLLMFTEWIEYCLFSDCSGHAPVYPLSVHISCILWYFVLFSFFFRVVNRAEFHKVRSLVT